MYMTFRWYGESDLIPLEYIRQIPGMKGIVSAIYDVPVGEAWPMDKILSLKEKVEVHGLELSVIESVPVHEDIKLGKSNRTQYIDNYITTIKRLGAAGVKIICYNFMPVFDWTRSDLEYQLPDGSTTLVFQEETVKKMNPNMGELNLPGWDSSYTKEELGRLLQEYGDIDEEQLWQNLTFFMEAIIPAAEEAEVKMAIHPDDPPWSIFGLPRIITNEESLERLLKIVDSPNNGLTFCSGSLGVAKDNNISQLVRRFGKRIHFVHMRNVRITGKRSFEEAAHLSSSGSLDMVEILKAYHETGFTGPIRPDHGRMIWGETGKPGYGLYDRALGATYLNGIWETLVKLEAKK